jgi:ADP-ribose pyrophosphatase YjhB (NUDIX family)
MNPAPQVAVGAVAVRERELLLIRRGHGPAAGRWSVPGGRVHFGEDLREAVVRELYEETGLEGVVTSFLGWVERIGTDPEPYHFVILDFAVDILDPDNPTPGDDAKEAKWVPLDDLDQLHLVDGLEDFLTEHNVLT